MLETVVRGAWSLRSSCILSSLTSSMPITADIFLLFETWDFFKLIAVSSKVTSLRSKNVVLSSKNTTIPSAISLRFTPFRLYHFLFFSSSSSSFMRFIAIEFSRESVSTCDQRLPDFFFGVAPWAIGKTVVSGGLGPGRIAGGRGGGGLGT